MNQIFNIGNDKKDVRHYKDKDIIKILNNHGDCTSEFVSYETKTKIEGSFDEPTLKLFGALLNAYNYFKKILFINRLSPVVLTLNRNTKSAGYYMPSAWVVESQIILPEININPAMLQLEPQIVASILVHEACHHLQYMYGKPSRGGYHNKQFAKLMAYMGLMCSDTCMPGGKTTGQRMGHYIINGGLFEQAFQAMPREYLIPFTSYNGPKKLRHSPRSKNKIKYECPVCDTALWGKPNQNVGCLNCKTKLIAMR